MAASEMIEPSRDQDCAERGHVAVRCKSDAGRSRPTGRRSAGLELYWLLLLLATAAELTNGDIGAADDGGK